MNCPRCNVLLLAGDFKDIPVHKCNSCHGMLFPRAQLVLILKRFHPDMSFSVSLDTHVEKVENEHGLCHCPSCNQLMSNFGYMGCDQIIIDNCGKCKLIWVDALELGEMSLLYARTEKRAEHRELDSRAQINLLELLEQDAETEKTIQELIQGAFKLPGF